MGTPTLTPVATATPTLVPTATPIPSPNAAIFPPLPTPTVFRVEQLSANVQANPVQLIIRWPKYDLYCNKRARWEHRHHTNDVLWLRIEPPDAKLSPVPRSPQVAIGYYPLLWYDETNQANVTVIPSSPLTLEWSPRPRAQEAVRSPAMVTDRGVFFTNQDGQHLYSYQRTNGDQR